MMDNTNYCFGNARAYCAALLSVFTILPALCDEPSAPTDWYIPNDIEEEANHAKLEVGAGSSKQEIDVTIGEGGVLFTTDGEKIDDGAYGQAAKNSLRALRQAFIAEYEVKTLPGDDCPIGNFETYRDGNANTFTIALIRAVEDEAPASVFNGEYCPDVMNQFGRGTCATAAAITYANFFCRLHGHDEMKFDLNRMFEKANVMKRKHTSSEGTRSIDNLLLIHEKIKKVCVQPLCCKFYFYAKNKDADSVRALVKRVIADHGGFIAGLNASIEWRELNHLRNHDNLTTITGKIKETWGTHDVLVFGYDEDYVYFQNSWGYNWGHYGQARIAWAEFVREFESGLFVVKADCMPD